MLVLSTGKLAAIEAQLNALEIRFRARQVSAAIDVKTYKVGTHARERAVGRQQAYEDALAQLALARTRKLEVGPHEKN